MSEPIRVVVTGAAGQIGYSLLYMISSGYVFGPDQPVILHLLDIAPMMGVLGGVAMEIDDCAFPIVKGEFLWNKYILTCYNFTNFWIDDCALPLVKGVVCTDNPEVGFKDVDAAFMVGAMPRREGMERKDLLAANV